jgi:Ni/Fe-hydrogenase subunit HybB-like protein
MRNKILPLAYWILLGVVALVGVATLYIRSVQGLQITNLTSLVPWGLWVAFYIYFIGLSAGSFLVSTMIYVFGLKRFEPIGRIALFSAFIALSAGLVFILIDLGHMERFWTVFVNRSSTSVLEWEIHFYNLYLAIMLCELWLLMRRDLIRHGQQPGFVGALCRVLAFGSRDLSDESAAHDMKMVKVLGMLGVPVALAVHGGTGAIFAVVKARPYWDTAIFPLLFIVSALVSGGALLTFIYAFFGRRDADHTATVIALGKMVAGFLIIDLTFLVSELLVGLYGNIPDHVATFRAIMSGPFWYVFWFGQLALGAVVPLFIIFYKRTGSSVGWVGIASALMVMGIFGVRLNIVIPPFTVPLLPGLDSAYPLGRFSAFEFTGPGGVFFGLSILVFVLAAGVITSRLAQLPSGFAGRALAWVSGIAIMIGFVAIGLRFMGIGVPVVGSVLGEQAALPFFFGGAVRATDATFYVPSAIEWLTSMGVIALAVIGFSLGWRLLPLQAESQEHAPEPARGA